MYLYPPGIPFNHEFTVSMVMVSVTYLKWFFVLQVKWLLKLSQIPEVKEVPPFSEEAQLFLDAVIRDFSIDDAKEVKQIEKITNHDVKAVEYYLKQKCSSNPEVEKVCRREETP
jgi:adenylosuccinate lyase